MSGLLSPHSVHTRTRAALAEWARSQGRSYDEAAAILGIGHASAYRRLSGEDSTDWTLRDLVRALCHAERIDGDRSVLDQILHDVRGDLPASTATRTIAAATALLASLGGEVQALAQRLGDGRITIDEAKATLAELPGLRLRIDELEAACHATVGDPR